LFQQTCDEIGSRGVPCCKPKRLGEFGKNGAGALPKKGAANEAKHETEYDVTSPILGKAPPLLPNSPSRFG